MDGSRRINANLYQDNNPIANFEVAPLEGYHVLSSLDDSNRQSYMSLLLQPSPIRSTPDIHLNNGQGWNHNTGPHYHSGSGLGLNYMHGSFESYNIEPFQQLPHFENNSTNSIGQYHIEPVTTPYSSSQLALFDGGMNDRYIPNSHYSASYDARSYAGLQAMIQPDQGVSVFPNIHDAPYAQGELHQLVASQLYPQHEPNPNNSLEANMNPRYTQPRSSMDRMYDWFQLGFPEEQLTDDDIYAALQDWSYEALSIMQEPVGNVSTGLTENEIAWVVRIERFRLNSLEGVNAPCCSICLEDYNDEEELRVIRKCNHKFHKECIGNWLIRKSTCPLCREDV